nr:hypothetical protein [Rhizoctonia sp.]
MWDRSPVIAALGSTGIVLGACYSIWMYNRISFGSFSPYLVVTDDLSRREFMLLISLLIPIVLFGFFPNIILDSLHVGVTGLLYNISPTTPFSELTESSLAFSFLVVPLMGGKLAGGNLRSNKPKVNPSGVRAISNQVDNTLVESLDLNKNNLQCHTAESIKTLAQKLEVEEFLNWLVGFSDAESTFFRPVRFSVWSLLRGTIPKTVSHLARWRRKSRPIVIFSRPQSIDV